MQVSDPLGNEAAPVAAEASSAPETDKPAEPPSLDGSSAEQNSPPGDANAPVAAADTASEQSAPAAASSPAPDASVEMEEVEVAVWRFAPRRPPQKRPQHRRENDGETGRNDRNQGRNHAAKGANGKSGNGRPPQRASGPGKPGQARGKGAPKGDTPYRGAPKNQPKKGAEGHAPRHRKVADPDSPFAVLAGLKGDLEKSPGKS